MTDFVTDLPESAAREGAKRGRPSIFTPALQADLTANPGQYAVLQTEVKGRSRVSALRTAHEGFQFEWRTTGHSERVNAKGETVVDDIGTIYVRKPVPAAEVADSVAETTPDEAPVETPKRARAAAKK